MPFSGWTQEAEARLGCLSWRNQSAPVAGDLRQGGARGLCRPLLPGIKSWSSVKSQVQDAWQAGPSLGRGLGGSYFSICRDLDGQAELQAFTIRKV